MLLSTVQRLLWRLVLMLMLLVSGDHRKLVSEPSILRSQTRH